MQDGNSTTLTEAIERHGGEAVTVRSNFRALPQASKDDLIAFLNNLVLFKAATGAAEETNTQTQPSPAQMNSMGMPQ
jgi:hypothetical protein